MQEFYKRPTLLIEFDESFQLIDRHGGSTKSISVQSVVASDAALPEPDLVAKSDTHGGDLPRAQTICR